MRNISSVGWFVILCGVYWFVYWFVNRRRAPVVKKQAVLTGHVAETRRLTGACFGDRAKADRLIQYEKTRDPGINHSVAVNRALDRLKIDRGRHSA